MSCERNAHFLNAPFAYHPKKVSVKRSLEALAAKTSKRKLRALIPKWRFLLDLFASRAASLLKTAREGRINKKKKRKSLLEPLFITLRGNPAFCRMAD
ncbi:hypothetical protein CEXT_505401 [Caerostris extrusa]|uniref:Uncharacterized protein n=1 Tax=Caerostris extrusa TaxID=172846 RepID=A0AAV4UCR3_CAEEX|nr:hypothetical protein CEXT_505401 [Caerostris extrusa]